MRDVTDAAFEREVLAAGGATVVDFWAPWCRPCESVSAILEELEREYAGRIAFARLNVDENPQSSARFGVLSLPTAIVFEGGEARETVVGARSRADYERAFAAWLSSSP